MRKQIHTNPLGQISYCYTGGKSGVENFRGQEKPGWEEKTIFSVLFSYKDRSFVLIAARII